MDGNLERVTDKYSDVKFSDMTSPEQQEFLGAIAKRASAETLKAIGLDDAYAVDDIRDLRDILKGFRAMKKTAWTTTFSALGRILGWIIILALAGALFRTEVGKRLAVDILQ